jgi:hypothetical protein
LGAAQTPLTGYTSASAGNELRTKHAKLSADVRAANLMLANLHRRLSLGNLGAPQIHSESAAFYTAPRYIEQIARAMQHGLPQVAAQAGFNLAAILSRPLSYVPSAAGLIPSPASEIAH